MKIKDMFNYNRLGLIVMIINQRMFKQCSKTMRTLPGGRRAKAEKGKNNKGMGGYDDLWKVR